MASAFGRALRQARKTAGLSQEALALEAGLDRTYPSLLERGLRQPTVSVLFALAAVLNVEPEALIAQTRAQLEVERLAAFMRDSDHA